MFPVPGLSISISGIRGHSPEVLTPGIAYALIRGYMQMLPAGSIVLARDARSSGTLLKQAVLQALADANRTVLDIDLLPLPTAQIYTVHTGSVAGIDITASHNPPEYNGLKLLDAAGNFLPIEVLEAIVAQAEHYTNYVPAPSVPTPAVHTPQATAVHLAKLQPLYTTGTTLRVAVDACNSAGSFIFPQLLQELGCSVLPIATDPSKPFPRLPEPTPAHLQWTQEQLRGKEYDVCTIVDPDSDRLTLIDEQGTILSEEYTLPLIASLFILQGATGTIVINQSTSQMVELLTKGTGITIARCPVGEYNLVTTMRRTKAIFGGEGSGGMIDPRVHYGRDALTGIVHIISLLRLTGKTLSQLVAELPMCYMAKHKVAMNKATLPSTLRRIQQAFPIADVTTTDGLRLTFADQSIWVHIRASNTEPIVRIIAEGVQQTEVDALCEEVKLLLQQG